MPKRKRMKCVFCGHEPKEEQPKFCSQCGARLQPAAPPQDDEQTAGTTEPVAATQDEPQPLKDTGPPTKKRKKRNRNKKGKKRTSSESDSTNSLMSLPSSLEVCNDEEDNDCDSDNEEDKLPDTVIAEEGPDVHAPDEGKPGNTPPQSVHSTFQKSSGDHLEDDTPRLGIANETERGPDTVSKPAEDSQNQELVKEKVHDIELSEGDKNVTATQVTSQGTIAIRQPIDMECENEKNRNNLSDLQISEKETISADNVEETTAVKRKSETTSKPQNKRRELDKNQNVHREEEAESATSKKEKAKPGKEREGIKHMDQDREKRTPDQDTVTVSKGELSKEEKTNEKEALSTSNDTSGSTTSEILTRRGIKEKSGQNAEQPAHESEADLHNGNDQDKTTEEGNTEGPTTSSTDSQTTEDDQAMEVDLNQNDENAAQPEDDKTNNAKSEKIDEKRQKQNLNKSKQEDQKQSSAKGDPKDKDKESQNETLTRSKAKQQEARERDPASLVTVYFHVIVSKHFNLKPAEDKVVVKAGNIKGFKPWKDVICEMHYSEEIKDHGLLYVGHTYLSKDNVDKSIPYKYMVIQKDKSGEYEYIYNTDVAKNFVNRCLRIHSHSVFRNEWHQYDDVCMKENQGFFNKIKKLWNDKYKFLYNAKVKAGEVMLSGIFSLLATCDDINLTSFFHQLHQFYLVSSESLLYGDHPMNWKSHGFSSQEIHKLILESLNKMCEPFLDKKEKTAQNQLLVGLVYLRVSQLYSIPYSKENLVKICSVLCLAEKPRELMIGELQTARNMFSKYEGMDRCLRHLCQRCIDDKLDHWVWVLPVLHTFTSVYKSESSLAKTKGEQEDVWAGLEGLDYEKLKKQDSNVDLLNKMVTKKHLLQADPVVIQSWLCLIPIDNMVKFLEELPIIIVVALRACYFKFHGVEYYQRSKVETILKKLLSIMDGKGTFSNTEAFQGCARVSLDLHNRLCLNTMLKKYCEIPCLSAEIILTVIKVAGLSEINDGTEAEDASQMSETEKVLQEALKLTKAWIQDVYGCTFNFHDYRSPKFQEELSAWSQILKTGEGVTPEWKQSLLQVLLSKIKQEQPFKQIAIYCKEQSHFKELHPSISKCFEDCAIEAVHLACQSENDILSQLSTYNLENFGRLVSSVIENSWPKDGEGKPIKDGDEILKHLLEWKDALHIFKLYGTDSRIISKFGEDIQELVALSESVFLEARRNVLTGEVQFRHMEWILENKKQFLAICKLKFERKENLSLRDIERVLAWRKDELDTFKKERKWVDSLLKMVQSIQQFVRVTISGIIKIHQEPLGPKWLKDILQVTTLESDDCSEIMASSYYGLEPEEMDMAKQLDMFMNSDVFISCWEGEAQAYAEVVQSSDESEVSLEEVMEDIFNPCFNRFRQIYNALKSGDITFEKVDKYLGDFKNNYDKLKKELRILCLLGDLDPGRWIPDRVKQIEQYHQLHVAFHSAMVIYDVKNFLNLSGMFNALETLLNFAKGFDNFKQNPLTSISDDVMKTRTLLSAIEDDHITCLEEVLLRKDFFNWVKEALEDVNELKVFVDLASISAGENDMDVDRVACFHDAVLGYAPLLYDVKPDFGFNSFMACLEKLWKALKSDPKLPKKLRDSARHVEWLKTVKESHGSVELSSLSFATSINKKGIYYIKAPRDSKKITPDTVLQLVLPDEESPMNGRYYSLEELKELLNKLMLMSGKGDQGNLEVDKFSEVFSNVQRLAGSFIDLYLAGNMLFRSWEAEIYCSEDAGASVLMTFNVEGIDDLEGHTVLTDLLPDICKTMEDFLEDWLMFINRKRSLLYYLNYYTAEQLVFLCQHYERREISEEVLIMLSFIKPDCAKIDTVKSLYFPGLNISNQTCGGQPNMMDFTMNLQECPTVSRKLELVWKHSMEYMSSLFPGCLDIETLGRSLAALAEMNKTLVVRSLHPSLLPGRPNLILCPPSEILSCTLAVYMHNSEQPLPSYDEVLLCSSQTTFEEVALFLRRCLTPGYSGKKVYSLVYADQLIYDVGYKAEQLFQQLLAQGMDNYNLVIICNGDREHCYMPSVFSQFKVHMIPQKPLGEIQRYLATHFKVSSKVVSAAPVFKNGMSSGIVSSKRAGVGKSLYVKRLYQKLKSKFPSKDPVLKIIRLIKPEVDESKVLETLLPFLDGKTKTRPVIFHIDITSSVTSGISEFLFKLLVLHYLMDSEGRVWKRLPSHLYIIEILETSDMFLRKQFKSVLRMVQNNFLNFFPKVSCCSPKEVLTRSTQAGIKDSGDPEMDMEEFCSECFQRPYQYLIRFDEGQNLDTFRFRAGHVEGDPARCLQIFLLYCGIVDPSWSELRNFAWFLNLQLKDCESSVFCNHEIVGDTLQGFKNFVVNFMILMAKDFATPSLHIADQSPGRQEINLDGVTEQDLVPFLLRKRWESEPHPYIFFNDDHVSMTFIGFHLQPNNAGGVDAINPRDNSIIRQNIMTVQLYEGLRLQRVPFNIDFDQLPRHEKITKLSLVLGIQWPMDPDETYELTMDNILKILAIKMRFRCGIPVVIMGETGCGKTRLIKFLCHLCKGFVDTENMKLVKVHGGTTAETIYQKILEAQEIAQMNKIEGCDTVLFFDEANTTEAISSIKEALCDRTVQGVPLEEDSGLQIIAACNPYRKHTDDMIKRLESAGLGYRVKADETKERLGSIPLRQLVYRVHALPPSMMPLVWDFGQLNNETEKMYIQQIVQRLSKEVELTAPEIKLITNVLSASQSYMRKRSDECSFVSLRDVERCIEVFKWFHSHHSKLTKHRLSLSKRGRFPGVPNVAAWSLVLAAGVCYHASLETKDSYRRVICKLFPGPYGDPNAILNEITSIQDMFLAGVQLRDTIARNLALKENLFMMVICIELKIPLFLVGKPGSSKSLAKTIVADAMQGQAAHTELYKDLKQIHLVSFQCSPHSTPEGIIGTFKHCARFQEGKNLNEYVSVVVLDEIGLAEDSPKMPLKTLHPLLEDGCIDDDPSPHKKVGFIGISNWALDPAKMNRGIFVSRGDPNKEELVESAKGICSSDQLILRKVQRYFPNFSDAYLKVCETQQEEDKEFFGLRDFYSLIKMVFAFTKQSKDDLTLNDTAKAVLRNFSGKDEVNALDIFLKEEKKDMAEIDTIDLVMENIYSDSDDCRYLLILTKNYAALQILQQAFLKENQQPEIIFGSSFPKDQEYTQICRNINRVKICMETGQMVILLNLQNLYESLYDALNQYYVYLAGQKYVDLGLGTHRVKCRVHPKFRLIVIEEKDVVYRDFPIPLINRLEKHYLDINTFLKKEHKVVVAELEGWVNDFTKGNTEKIIGKSQTYSPSDVFIGYHSDTCASVVLQVTENMKHSHPLTNTENTADLKYRAINILLNCATPDSVIRLDRKPLIEEYFKKQKHGSLLDFLSCHVTCEYNNRTIFTEITTFSRLLTSADKKVLEAELQDHVRSIEILSLEQFDTEFSFLKKIRNFLESYRGNLILIIQTDFEEGSEGAHLVASAKYSAVNEINKVNLTDVSVFVYFITKLPRVHGGTTYVGFRGGLWQSVHIDDLRKSKDMVADVTALQNLTISQLFYTEERKEPVKDEGKQKAEVEKDLDVEMAAGNEDQEVQPIGDGEEMRPHMEIDTEENDEMETEQETPEEQEMDTDVPLPRPEDMLDTTILIRSCIQNAIALLRDEDNVDSRSTRRVEILINLLSTDDQMKSCFLKMVKSRLHGLLKAQEENVFRAAEWVTREAANQDALQEAGTFRQTLWKRVQTAVTPFLSQILSVVDRNANLDLLVDPQVDDFVKSLWMQIFQDEKFLPISDSSSSQTETILVRNYMNISTFGENHLPFSWRIKDYLEEIWTQAQHIESREGPERKFLDIFSQTPLGRFISFHDDNSQYNAFLRYKRDFLLMTMSISSAEELRVLEFALSTCIEELRLSTNAKEPLPLPWVNIAYHIFQHRLQNLGRILVISPEVFDFLMRKIEDQTPVVRKEMALDIFAAIACLETLKDSIRTLHPQVWMQQVKSIQVPIELIISEGYLQDYSPWCKTGIKQVRSYWNCAFSMSLFMEHLLIDDTAQDEEMQQLIRGHTVLLGRRLENFADVKTEKPFMAMVDVLHKCRDEVAKSVSRFGMQVCAICLGDPTEPVCLDCDHFFCRSCLKKWLESERGDKTCPTCKTKLPEPFVMAVSAEMRDAVQKYIAFRKRCNGFFVDIMCNLCFKDNTPPDDKVIRYLLDFLFGCNVSTLGRRNCTRSLSPFEDAVDKTPVIRSVILKLLLKYSFDQIMAHAQDFLYRVKSGNFLLTLEDTIEVYLLFINCLEDALFENKQKLLSDDEKRKYLREEGRFLQDYTGSCRKKRQDEKSVQFLQDVARVRLALDTAAEMLSVTPRGVRDDHFLKCVIDLCSQAGNDWYRVYLIRKLANSDGIDIVQMYFKDPKLGWLFPREMLQNKDGETNRIDQFLVCGDSYKVLRDGIGRAMIEGKEERIVTAIEECGSRDQALAVHLLLAIFREITDHYGKRRTAQQGMAPEQEAIKAFLKNVRVFRDAHVNRFVDSLLNNIRPVLRVVPGMRSSHVTILGLAMHMGAILVSGNSHLLSPLKNLAFFPARMLHSFLPTMPEDMFVQARAAMRDQVRWYTCPNGHYCAVGECGQPMELSRCTDCGLAVGGQNHAPVVGFQMQQNEADQTKTGHVLGDPDRLGPAVAPDRDILAPAFILLRMVTHLSMLLGSEEDTQSVLQIVTPPVRDVPRFLFRHIERDLEYLRNSLGKSADDTTTVVHLILHQMLQPQQAGQWPVNFNDTLTSKDSRNSWEKHFASIVILPVLRSLDRDLAVVNNYISQDERISSNPIVKVVKGDPLIIGEGLVLPRDSHVHCSKVWSCRERISIEYLLHIVQQKDGKDTLPLLWKFLEKETELQMVKFLPDTLKLQKDLVKKFQNCKDIGHKTIREYLESITSGGAQSTFERRIGKFIQAWNHLRISLQANGEIKLPEDVCEEVLSLDSDFELLLPRRQGKGLCATALSNYLIALHNSFIYALATHTNTEQKYSIKASEVMDLHVISYEMEKDLVPIILSNCQYSLESGKETLQEIDFPKIQDQISTRLLQGKPRITIVGLPTLTLSHDRNYENLFTDVKKRLPQESLSNSTIDVMSRDLSAFSDVCEALHIVDVALGFLATSGEDPDLSLTTYVEDVLQMREQSSAHVLEALKRCHLKHTIALWQLLTALKSQHLLHLKRDPFPDVDKVYKVELDKARRNALNIFLEQNGTNLVLLELHEMITLRLRKPQSADDFKPSWILRDVLGPLLDEKDISFPELENDFPEEIALAHSIAAWKVIASKKWSRL
ncbi:LOW QUALITY PROTEIN: E3 ubiquitin-protein ligase RNF213-like [Hyperolius riggenbachi]|uniref:LOW QUALITY PROTEIN: E3 ubiquitin-protein ligase RNF213-like n=1 Tax=Hyperolius riggenbachi TaxID=752182 RepID=UPI0035A2740E